LALVASRLRNLKGNNLLFSGNTVQETVSFERKATLIARAMWCVGSHVGCW